MRQQRRSQRAKWRMRTVIELGTFTHIMAMNDLEGGNDDGNNIINDGGDSDGERAPQESCSYSRSMHRGRLLG